VPTWVLIVAVMAAVFVACADDPVGKAGLYVQRSWTTARAVSGHRVHVTKAKVACSKCHSMTGDAMGPVTPEACAGCHQSEAHIRHASVQAEQRFGAGIKADCTACHAFTVEGSSHEQALQRLEAARPRAAGNAGAFSLGLVPYSPEDCKRCHATAQSHTPAVKAHGEKPCVDCHRPHQDPEPRSAACEGCHADIEISHAAKGQTPTQACATCHQHLHADASEARTSCAPCHAVQSPRVPATALFENGHRECSSCHQAHRFEQKQAVACRSCHEENVLGGTKIPAHAQCSSCHAPHDVAASAAAACSNCHQTVHPDHPQQGGQGSCVGCHDPHPATATALVTARACSSCHQFAGSDHAAHGKVACTQCHQPHHFALELADRSACQACHAARVQQVATNTGHAACESCHRGLPHRPEALEVGCDTCHASQHTASAANAGHARCSQCHEPHSGAQQVACASCHRAEHQSAPVGHQTCTNCHEPHGGSPVTKPCAGCHEGVAQSAHGKLASGCGNCHRPHGPGGPRGPAGPATPPACSSCHARETLPGLHREPRHAACTTCHQSAHRDTELGIRSTCVGCHTDRAQHFPDGPRCANCHLFGG
jgi:hypothetical protein